MRGTCLKCAGSGWLWQCIAQDESIKVKCDSCGGVSKIKIVVAKSLSEKAAEKAAAEKQQAEVAGTTKGDFIMSIMRRFK